MNVEDLFDNEQKKTDKPAESPLKSLETDLIIFSESIKEISEEIIREQVSDYPIFIAHQHEVSVGELIIDKEEVSSSWSINVATLDDFITAGIIKREKADFFKKNYKDPALFMCVFTVVEEGANFVFYPYK